MTPARDAPRHFVVTGGAGFLGAHVCRRLADRGDTVLCVDDLSAADLATAAELSRRPAITVRQASVTDPITVEGRVDAVLHLACPASPRDYLARPTRTLLTGGLGTVHALELARSKDARIVVASTSEVYGDPLSHPQHESYWGNVNPIGPRSVYDEAKRYGEAAAAAYRREFGVDSGIVRIFNTYGPGMRVDDGRVVPSFLRAACAGQPLPIQGDGTQTRSLCYVDDLVDGLLAMAESDHPGPLNLGNPVEMSILEIADLINRIVESSAGTQFVPAAQDDPRRRCPDIGAAQRVLGWSPRTAVDDGLVRTLDWYRRTHCGVPLDRSLDRSPTR